MYIIDSVSSVLWSMIVKDNDHPVFPTKEMQYHLHQVPVSMNCTVCHRLLNDETDTLAFS